MYIEVSFKQFVFHIVLVFTLIEKIESQDERHYLKIVMIIDHETYLHHSSNITQCELFAQEIVTGAGYYLKAHSFFISLVESIVWTDEYEEIEYENDNIETLLQKFSFLKSSNPLFSSIFKNYTLVFLTKRVFVDDALGLAYFARACSKISSTLIVSWYNWPPQVISAILAHEIGHLISMMHTDLCFCPYDWCIMSASVPHSLPTTIGWTNCSFDYFEAFKKTVHSQCLTMPKDDGIYSYCGDGIVEADEECDCGPRSVGCQCCHAQTCTLTSNAVCGSGPCCNLTTCNYIEASSRTVCRKAAHQACDFVEYCDGQSRFCPEDKTIHDGIRCAIDGFCYKGKCGSSNEHCTYLMESTSMKADLLCFHENNRRKSIFPCGTNNTEGKLCSYLNIECGRLNCVVLVQNNTIIKDYQNYTVKGSRGNKLCEILTLDNLLPKDAGLAPNGALCGFDYLGICIDTECIPVHQIINENPCPANCNGHGVCDNLGQCHCNPGYNQPDCS